MRVAVFVCRRFDMEFAVTVTFLLSFQYLDTIYTEYGVAMTVVSGLNYNFTTRLVITVSCTARYARSGLILT